VNERFSVDERYRGGRLVRVALLGLLLVTSAFVFSTCGGAREEVRLGMVDWPEAVAKTNVAAIIVEALGYETEIQELSVPSVFEGLESGNIDVFVEAWFPTMQPNLDEIDPDSVESVAINLPEATFSVAVNRAACQAGVLSHEDLNDFSNNFEEDGQPTIFGIEPANDGNQVVLEMIASDTYELGEWKLVESSTNGMLSEVERRTQNGEWVAFVGWEPHWMNNKYEMCLLEDPQEAWGGKSHVETLVNEEFSEKYPQLYRFFKQMKVNREIQAQLIDQIDNSGKEPEEIAVEWLRANPRIAGEWLEGISATDGTEGFEALRRYLERTVRE
jgi:glycine betaine/proline transport system substrate-binding protein